jgi:hypothetical protein
MKIAFSDLYVTRRGSTVALYDFAHYNETILGNESIILLPNDERNDPTVIDKFKGRFDVFEYRNNQIDTIIKKQNVDALYLVKGNNHNTLKSKIVPNLIHMVFVNNPEHYHGDRFAFISDWLSALCKLRYNLDKPSVPWMINIQDVLGDLREELHIPKDAFVFGYHGGEDCFGIPWVGTPILQALNDRPNLYLALMNIDKKMTPLQDHPRIIWVPGTGNMDYKAKFIKTCDAMLHARHCGESFGLSCGEFSILNKPIVGCNLVEDRCHIELLGDKFIGYNNPQELYTILMDIDHTFVKSANWDCYSKRFNPETVMKKFKEVFLDPIKE